jgi:hypothetical protein
VVKCNSIPFDFRMSLVGSPSPARWVKYYGAMVHGDGVTLDYGSGRWVVVMLMVGCGGGGGWREEAGSQEVRGDNGGKTSVAIMMAGSSVRPFSSLPPLRYHIVPQQATTSSRPLLHVPQSSMLKNFSP